MRQSALSGLVLIVVFVTCGCLILPIPVSRTVKRPLAPGELQILEEGTLKPVFEALVFPVCTKWASGASRQTRIDSVFLFRNGEEFPLYIARYVYLPAPDPITMNESTTVGFLVSAPTCVPKFFRSDGRVSTLPRPIHWVLRRVNQEFSKRRNQELLDAINRGYIDLDCAASWDTEDGEGSAGSATPLSWVKENERIVVHLGRQETRQAWEFLMPTSGTHP